MGNSFEGISIASQEQPNGEVAVISPQEAPEEAKEIIDHMDPFGLVETPGRLNALDAPKFGMSVAGGEEIELVKEESRSRPQEPAS
jgi:hypothetical protein